MKRTLLKTLAGAAILLSAVGCTQIERGEVGVLFSKYGSDKGVNEKVLPPGLVWYNPIKETIYTYPTFTQTQTWSGKQAISFQTSDGMRMSSDIGLVYFVDPDKVTKLFQKYRNNLTEITDKFLWNIVRDAFNIEASKVSSEAAYGSAKSALLDRVEDHVRAQVEPIGIVIERISYASELVLPESLKAAIERKNEANQIADQRRNEVAQAKEEANKLRELAQGKADSQLIVAEAEAKAIELRAAALRNNQDIIQLNAIEKWDGKLPTYVGGGNTETPFISIK